MSEAMWSFCNYGLDIIDASVVLLLPLAMVMTKVSKKTFAITVILFSCTLYACNTFEIGGVGNAIYIGVVLLGTCFVSRKKPIKTFAWTLIALALQVVIELIISSIAIKITSNPNFYLDAYTSMSPTFIAIGFFTRIVDCFVVFFVGRKYTLKSISSNIFWWYLSLPILSVVMGLVIISEVAKGRVSPNMYLLLMLFIVSCNILALMLINIAIKNMYETERAKSQAKINQMDRMQYIKLAEKSDSIRAWKHDVRQVMNGALAMIQQGRDEEAELILKSKLSTMQVETTAIKSGNIIVDAILTKMVDECFDKNIPLVMRAEIPSAIMSEDDTCEVLGTLLDSAIDVSCKQNDRKIDFMMQGGEQFRIQISTNAVLYSDKEKNALKETENRISKVLSKYNGIVSAKYDDEQKVVVWTLLVPLQKDIVWLTTYVYDTTDVVGETGNEQTEKELV